MAIAMSWKDQLRADRIRERQEQKKRAEEKAEAVSEAPRRVDAGINGVFNPRPKEKPAATLKATDGETDKKRRAARKPKAGEETSAPPAEPRRRRPAASAALAEKISRGVQAYHGDSRLMIAIILIATLGILIFLTDRGRMLVDAGSESAGVPDPTVELFFPEVVLEGGQWRLREVRGRAHHVVGEAGVLIGWRPLPRGAEREPEERLFHPLAKAHIFPGGFFEALRISWGSEQPVADEPFQLVALVMDASVLEDMDVGESAAGMAQLPVSQARAMSLVTPPPASRNRLEEAPGRPGFGETRLDSWTPNGSGVGGVVGLGSG